MTKMWINLVLMHLFASCATVEADHTQQKSNIGKEFYVGILKPYHTQVSIELLVSSNTSGSVTVHAPEIGMQSTQYIINGEASILVNNRIIQENNDAVENKGIRVTSDVDIALSIVISPSNMFEGALAYPLESLSTEYIVATYSIFDPRWHSEFLIVGTANKTTVHFYRRKDNTLESGSFTDHLDALQTYLYQSTHDISGSILRSDKPVAVFSGNEAAEVPSGVHGGEYLFEQMPPTDTFGDYFIVPNIIPKPRFVIRIFSKVANATITYYNSSFTISEHNMEAGQYLEVQPATEPMVVHGDQTLMVVQYGASRLFTSDHVGDPFMSVVPAINQYMNEYHFTVSSKYTHFGHYFSVIADRDTFAGVLLDGATLSNELSSHTVIVKNKPYVVNVYRTQKGFHHLVHKDGGTFGAMLYGYSDTTDDNQAYGYPLGVAFSVTNNHLPNTSLTDGNMCFSCNDLTHLYLCDTVKRCKSTERCYVEKTTTSGGQLKYNSGCVENAKCTSDGTSVGKRSAECVECCSGDYCNSHGCGGTGLPPRDNRGPLCFDCAHVETMDECRTVRLCQMNEVCNIEMFVWGGIFNQYTAKCHSSQCTPSSRALNNVQQRSTPDCHNCCHDDFCNDKCSLNPTSGVVVG